jgi:arylsulfatase A-like enzyme
VSATPHEGEPLRGQLGAGAPGVVDLAPLGGQVVRLELVAAGCAEAALAGAALNVPGAAPEVKRGAAPRYVVWWVMDTLRGDRTRTVNPQARAEVPNLEKLVAGGVGFRQFYVQGNESQTSHSSFWTAQYPANHHVITAGPRTNYQLAARFPQMGPVMTATGMRTIGVTSNGNIEDWTGYTRGFEEFENLMEDGTGKKLGYRVPASVVVDRVLEHLDDVSRPFFLFMGTTDTHKPWFARQPWLDRYHPEPYKGLFEDRVMSRWLGIPFGTHLCKEKLSPKDLKRIFAIYDSSISYQDDQLGRFIGELEKRGIADETMIIVTADHGEELWEYPETCGHGSSLRESLVHVPLVLWYPPLVPAVGAVDEGVEGVDLLPTVLDAIGKAPMDSAQGESLLPLVNGVGRGYVRPSYASMNEHSHTLRLGRWKGWIGRTGRMALYDMETDRDERNDLAAERPLERQMVNDALTLFVANRWKWKKREWGVASNMNAAAAEALEAR